MEHKNLSSLFSVRKLSSLDLKDTFRPEQYQILLFKGKGTLKLDFTSIEFDGNSILFTSPFQHINIQAIHPFDLIKVNFHGDFYCIEYHKEEVACNGLLFNNIYSAPLLTVPTETFDELVGLTHKLSTEIINRSPYSDPILKAYLQVMLAIGSKIKSQELKNTSKMVKTPSNMEHFKALLEEHFIQQRSPLFYANELALSPSVFTKKCKLYYGKAPSHLIQDRVILEAKKLIHLSYKSFKEIATLLNFQDEHYFSRYFKKNTQMTPTQFREQVGISIVADLSKT